MQQGNARSSESGRQSVLTLFADRVRAPSSELCRWCVLHSVGHVHVTTIGNSVQITQMLRYGSHPVVVRILRCLGRSPEERQPHCGSHSVLLFAMQILDGRVPGGKKDVYAGYERSTSEYCMLVKDLCDFMVRAVCRNVQTCFQTTCLNIKKAKLISCPAQNRQPAILAAGSSKYRCSFRRRGVSCCSGQPR